MPYVRVSFLNSTNKCFLIRRERKLKKELLSMIDQLAVLRKNRQRFHIPSVAIVGYTNCGKTSLIKALTGTTKLTPKNKLFATLDVTTHPAHLPCNMHVLFLDTVRMQNSLIPLFAPKFIFVITIILF